jgi:thiosulfate/3-mercaptopyruvate sulfurtransferase
MLITAEQLAAQLEAPGHVIVDCRFNLTDPAAGRRIYEAGHIPGAVHADLDRDLASPITPGTGRHPLPDPAALSATLRGWGVSPDTRVVAYDDAGGALAARLWWLLRWMGHARVALLDGGLRAWQSAGLPLETRLPLPAPGRFAGSPGHMPSVDTAAVLENVGQPRRRLLDARAPARFRGDEEPIDPVGGHVPGAVNVPFQDGLAADGRFLAVADLRQKFRPLAGAAGDASGLIAMCGSGVTACHLLFTLELAGLPGASLYGGSWSEWIRDPARPVARGPARAEQN